HRRLELPPHPPSAFKGQGHVTGGFCALHLFAEPDNEPPDKHPGHAFKAGLLMYRNAKGNQIDLDIVNPPKIDAIPQEEAAGFDCGLVDVSIFKNFHTAWFGNEIRRHRTQWSQSHRPEECCNTR